MQEMIEKAKELLANGTVNRVLAFKRGELPYCPEPFFFTLEKELSGMVYNGFCSANLSKYMIEAGKEEGKTLVFLRPCDTYSFNQLIKEHRVLREKAYIIGVGCRGKLDIEKMNALGIKGITSITEHDDWLAVNTAEGEVFASYEDVVMECCLTCQEKRHVVYDEQMNGEQKPAVSAQDRFARVKELEAMTPEERFAFWQGELSKCIRCNACRNVCPVCNCSYCVFDNDRFDTAQKANSDSFEEQMFHLIRAFHVAGRCTDCGECSRVCPQGIPLYLFNRKMILDINTFYGEYQAGEDRESRAPLTDFTLDDVEPSIVGERG